MSRSREGNSIKNARFRPKLKRKPRVSGRKFIYCPTMLTKHKDLKKNEVVRIVEISTNPKDPAVVVTNKGRYAALSEIDKFNVFWSDLRR